MYRVQDIFTSEFESEEAEIRLNRRGFIREREIRKPRGWNTGSAKERAFSRPKPGNQTTPIIRNPHVVLFSKGTEE